MKTLSSSKSRSTSVTLRDVAERAHVSMMTVSNFINGKLGSMSLETQERIRLVLEEMPYRPHSSARNLRLSRCFTVGQIVVDDSPYFMTRKVIGNIMAGLARELNLNGYSLMVQSVRLATLDEAPVMQSQLTEGLCVSISGSVEQRERFMDALCALNQPVVLLQSERTRPRQDVCTLRMDEYGGGVAIAEMFIRKGARKILMVIPAVLWPSVEERVRGTQAAVLATEGRCSLELLSVPEHYEGIVQCLAERFVGNPLPEAIITANEQIAFVALQLVQKYHADEPQDMLLATFDIYDPWNYMDNFCTTIRLPAFELGTEAARALLHRFQHGAFEYDEKVLDVALKERTVRIPRVDTLFTEAGSPVF